MTNKSPFLFLYMTLASLLQINLCDGRWTKSSCSLNSWRSVKVMSFEVWEWNKISFSEQELNISVRLFPVDSKTNTIYRWVYCLSFYLTERKMHSSVMNQHTWLIKYSSLYALFSMLYLCLFIKKINIKLDCFFAHFSTVDSGRK